MPGDLGEQLGSRLSGQDRRGKNAMLFLREAFLWLMTLIFGSLVVVGVLLILNVLDKGL